MIGINNAQGANTLPAAAKYCNTEEPNPPPQHQHREYAHLKVALTPPSD
ncbi:hypothetical protein [Candidatus Coxiella mudrowiae]|nr:hypothetical protein [Candidatus Coxiella mudrowiae]